VAQKIMCGETNLPQHNIFEKKIMCCGGKK